MEDKLKHFLYGFMLGVKLPVRDINNTGPVEEDIIEYCDTIFNYRTYDLEFGGKYADITGFKQEHLDKLPIDLVIPDRIVCNGDYKVSGTASNFNGRNRFKSVKLGKYMESVSDKSFQSTIYDGIKIETLELNEELLSIGFQAFADNRIKRLVLPSSLMSIGYDAFARNFGIVGKLVIPKSLGEIGGGAFMHNKITSLEIEDGDEWDELNIGYNAFSNNEISGHLVIPNKVKYIGENAFSNNKITSVHINNSVDGIVIETYAFSSNGEDGATEIIPTFSW